MNTLKMRCDSHIFRTFFKGLQSGYYLTLPMITLILYPITSIMLYCFHRLFATHQNDMQTQEFIKLSGNITVSLKCIGKFKRFISRYQLAHFSHIFWAVYL